MLDRLASPTVINNKIKPAETKKGKVETFPLIDYIGFD